MDQEQQLVQQQREHSEKGGACRMALQAGPPEGLQQKADAAFEHLLKDPESEGAMQAAVEAHGGGPSGWRALRVRLQEEAKRHTRRETALHRKISTARKKKADRRRREQRETQREEATTDAARFEQRVRRDFKEETGVSPDNEQLHGAIMDAITDPTAPDAPKGYIPPLHR